MSYNENETGQRQMEVATESTTAGKALHMLGKTFALTFSAITTAAFYFKYAGNAFYFVFGAWSPYITAVAGVIALDVMALIWQYLRGNFSNTVQQMVIARFMGYFTMGASVIVTGVYLLLNSSFSADVLADPTLVTGLNILGVLILTGGIVANFVAYFLFGEQSLANVKAIHSTEMMATRNQGKQRAEKLQQQLDTQYMLDDIQGKIHGLARQAGVQNADQFLGDRYGRRRPPAPSVTTPRLSPNTGGGLDDADITNSIRDLILAQAEATGRDPQDILDELNAGGENFH